MYPYHPLFRRGETVLDLIGLRSDMIVVQLQDGTHRGIPAWMFDPMECSTVRDSPRPIVHVKLLLRIVDLLEQNGWGNRTAVDEHQSKAQARTPIAGISACADSGASPIRSAGGPQPSPRRTASRVRRIATQDDGGRRRSSKSRRGRGQ